jgi:hypothetical protein
MSHITKTPAGYSIMPYKNNKLIKVILKNDE